MEFLSPLSEQLDVFLFMFLLLLHVTCWLETKLRSFSCLTTGDTIVIDYSNKKFYIDIVDTKPSAAVCIIDTDCEVDFAPPLDYEEADEPKPSNLSSKTESRESSETQSEGFSPLFFSLVSLRDLKISTDMIANLQCFN